MDIQILFFIAPSTILTPQLHVQYETVLVAHTSDLHRKPLQSHQPAPERAALTTRMRTNKYPLAGVADQLLQVNISPRRPYPSAPNGSFKQPLSDPMWPGARKTTSSRPELTRGVASLSCSFFCCSIHYRPSLIKILDDGYKSAPFASSPDSRSSNKLTLAVCNPERGCARAAWRGRRRRPVLGPHQYHDPDYVAGHNKNVGSLRVHAKKNMTIICSA